MSIIFTAHSVCIHDKILKGRCGFKDTPRTTCHECLPDHTVNCKYVSLLPFSAFFHLLAFLVGSLSSFYLFFFFYHNYIRNHIFLYFFIIKLYIFKNNSLVIYV